MNKIKLITSIATGLLITGSVFANEPCKTKEVCLLDSIIYIEEEADFELGFETADYLPEGFDPNSFYFDLNSVEFLEEKEIDFIASENLPEGFNPYANPKDFRHISYIDQRKEIAPIIETLERLPAPLNM